MVYEMLKHQRAILRVDYEKLVASAGIDDPFMTFSKKYDALCVAMVDIADSTYVTAKLPIKKTTEYYSLFLNSMEKTAKMFGARVVKNIGDSLLFYFPPSALLDEILDCTITMIKLRGPLNRAFKLYGLPQISYRISADYGPTLIATCKKTSQEDIFGNSVNMCSKINRIAQKNSLVIGSDLYSLAKSTPGYSFRHTGNYRSGFKQNYPVYTVLSHLR